MSGRQGHGLRTKKPPSAKQRAHAAHYKTQAHNVVRVGPADPGLPAESWWTRPRTRDEFDAAAAGEARRMAESKFGSHRGSGIRDIE